MQAIIIKYIQLFCVAVLFDNVSCDPIILKNYKDDFLVYKTTSCTASCLKNSNKTLKECYELVCENRTFNNTEPKGMKNAANFKIKLLCRSDTTLVVEVIDENDVHGNHFGHSKYFRKEKVKGNLYVVKIERANVLSSENIFYITESTLIRIENLIPNATYNITATLMYSNYTYTNAVYLDSVKTLPIGYKPMEPINLDLKFGISEKSNKTLDCFVFWDAADRSCDYDIRYYGRGDDHHNVDAKYVNQESLYNYQIRDLPFESTIDVGIEGVNRLLDLKTEIKWINKTTPTCWEWHKNDMNLEICPPYQPENIVVSTHFSSRDLYRMNVSWDKPKRQPKSYSIFITDFYNTKIQRDLPGETTSTFFEDVPLIDDEYEVVLTAFSLGGNSTKFKRSSLHNVLNEVTDESQTLRIILYMGSSIVAVILVIILVAASIHFKVKSRRRRYREELEKQRSTEMNNEDKKALLKEEIDKSFLNDGLEIDEDDIDVRDIIGEGAFGFVSRGILLPTGKEVAVKRLKDMVTFDVMRNFCQEVEVMRSVDKHPNIVGIVGHCMKDIEKMMILTEYCSRGNLREFLRNYWQRLMKCSLSKEPLKNGTIDENFSFQKPIESDFNFGSSIPEKNLTKQKNLHTVDDTLPVCIKNLIINKLYDECSDNFVSKQYYSHDCGNTCKSYVDIIEDKVKVSVKDCDCRGNQKNKILHYLDHSNFVENRGYDSECKINKFSDSSERILTKKDLLSFALQIATGMEFLSFNKVIHRDLAARNVCVCSDYTVKIADFGLSRDIYEENLYKKETNGKLPIKWLALESMTFQMYTSQSDVWSYGILLYEVVTLGSTPYPSIQTENLLKLLMSGYRMEKPPNCDDNVYELMLSCWKTAPSKRPTFTDIKFEVERLLKELTDNQPIHDKMLEKNSISISSSGSYLNPL